MSDLLPVLLLIYSAVLVANIVISTVMWKLHKSAFFKILIMMWTFSLINFVLQGFFMNPGVGMYAAFSSYVLVSFSLLYFTNHLLGNKKNYLTLGALCVVLLSIGLGLVLNNAYVTGSWFAAVAITLPQLRASLDLFKSRYGQGSQALAFLLVFNSLHFLDYPILRFNPHGAIAGFSIALFLLFSFSAFFPGFILFQITKGYADRLKEEVKNRTRELEEATEQNKSLVNILCHDVAAPLTVLDFYFEIMPQEADLEIKKHYEKNAMRSLKTLLEIVETVKELQTFSYGKVDMEMVPVEPIEVIEEVSASFERTLKEKNIQIRLNNNLSADSKISADRGILKNQVLSNLVSNAIKFSHSNSYLEIILREDNSHVELTIKDHGVGVPPELMPKLFKACERTTRLGTSKEKGTGFGLALVKTCIEMMGANIRVESQVETDYNSDHGSSFIIQFEKAS